MRSTIFTPRKHQLMMLIMLLCAWLPVSSVVSFSHSPVLTKQIEQQHHAELVVAFSEHNHNHHNDEAIGQNAGHGHASFDHDHELPQILPETHALLHPPRVAWLQQHRVADYPAPNYRLERPPRLDVVV